MFDTVELNQNIPQLGMRDFCATTGNCQGGGSGGDGVQQGDTSSGTFALDFLNGTLLTSITLDDFFVRYQGINSAALGFNGESGVGVTPPTGVPFCTVQPCTAGSRSWAYRRCWPAGTYRCVLRPAWSRPLAS